MSVANVMPNPDFRDRGQAADNSIYPKLSSQSLQRVLQTMWGKREWEQRPLYTYFARELNVDKEHLKQQVMRHAVDRIRMFEYGGEIRHYHRTNLEALSFMAREGKFLSHALLREFVPELKTPIGSGSGNVMFTRDKYKDGTLLERGLGTNDHGARGGSIIFVMKESIMDCPTYDSTDGVYPVVSELLIAPHCECILVNNPNDLQAVISTIDGTKLSGLPVYSKEQWLKKSQ